MKKTITIDSYTLKSFLLSLIISFLIVFTVNHFGTFSYFADTSGLPDRDSEGRFLMNVFIPPTTNVKSITYTSYFGSEVTVAYPDYKVTDVHWRDGGKFYEYSNTSKYYLNSTVKDYKYILMITISLFIASIFFKKFKFQIN